jgi:hypothetical protein
MSTEDDRVEYMIRRSLSICLTDLRARGDRARSVTFDATPLSELSPRVLYRPLLLLVNAVRMSRGFRSEVMSSLLRLLDSTSDGGIKGPLPLGSIDWEGTARGAAGGDPTPRILERRSPWSQADRTVLALVAAEFIGHCRVLVRAFGRTGVLQPAFVQQVSSSLEDIIAEADKLCCGPEYERWLPIANAEEQLRPSLEALERGIERTLAGDDPAIGDGFEAYQKLAGESYRPLRRLARLSRRALAWRDVYLSLETGLGPGVHLSCLQARDPAHLFELWCFMEFAYTLLNAGHGDVVQCSALRTEDKGATFRFGKRRSAYFNYYGRRFSSSPRSKLMKDIHVEWFIEDRKRPRKSVVLDTKYKNYASDDALKVYGYMNVFGIDRGVVIFSGDIRLDAFEATFRGDRIAITRWTEHSSEKVFCGLSLVPEPAEQERNTMVLGQLIREVVSD